MGFGYFFDSLFHIAFVSGVRYDYYLGKPFSGSHLLHFLYAYIAFRENSRNFSQHAHVVFYEHPYIVLGNKVGNELGFPAVRRAVLKRRVIVFAVCKTSMFFTT